ncbi:hypothetical protein RJ639_004364 [Escallonia herrerae]|uniref:Exonuclease domain-containing protein n=1 Tax=Escallonia herrerae TaxID=1293975 RepID=A0AA88W1Q1_9ASTE|nr:hypothetical protein RJ639_004364 [Escallonia herrerae]
MSPPSSMADKFDAAGKEVLVEIVKLAQKRGMKGSNGGWKEFLSTHDKKFGASLSDPGRRSIDVLVSFLKTFSQEDDLKFFDKVMQCFGNRDAVVKFEEKAADSESPEQYKKPNYSVRNKKCLGHNGVQRLVRTTLEHPQYPLNYSFPSYEEVYGSSTCKVPGVLWQGWLVTKRSKKSKSMRSAAMVAVDCEMVLCEDGTEALVKVCVVDRNLQVKLNELVNPNKAVADYRTEITGISAKDLDKVTCSLADIQKSMKNLLPHGTILVGHSLNNDLQALKVDHARVIDTSLVFKYDGPNHRRPSLNDLCKASLKCISAHLIFKFIKIAVTSDFMTKVSCYQQSVLGYELRQKDTPHNCLDDACAAMKLVLAKVEGGVKHVIPLVHKDVPDVDMAKLLIHGIPISVPKEELHKFIPGDFTIEMKVVNIYFLRLFIVAYKSDNENETGGKCQLSCLVNKRAGGKYSVLAIFKNQEEANLAFEDLDSNQERDSSGRPQKIVSFQLSTGVTGSVYVRKMAHDDPVGQSKRSLQDTEVSVGSKKLKTDEIPGEESKGGLDECDIHLKEIERLKQELSQRDQRILNLEEILVAFTKRQGLAKNRRS